MKKIATEIPGASDGSGKLVYFAWTCGKDGDVFGVGFCDPRGLVQPQ